MTEKVSGTTAQKAAFLDHFQTIKTAVKRSLKHLHSTQDDQEHIISQRQQHAGVTYVTLEDDSLSPFWQSKAPRPRNLQQQPH